MLTTIKGTYDHGRITLLEQPPINIKAEVIVTFLNEEPTTKIPAKRKLGGLEGKVNIPADFNELSCFCNS